MRQQQMQNARIVASVAATVISLACGTNYGYSAWAPQFAERLRLSSTESNLIGLAGNLGMYLLGVPVGIFVDHYGPRPAVLAGAVLLAIGYLPLRQAYDSASGSVAVLGFFYCLSGLGGCLGNAAAVKTSALNWPQSRGTATAFPLAAFGLSAFFFSLLGSVLFQGNPSDFLMLLTWAPCGLTLVSFFFLRVYPHTSAYQPVPGAGHRASLSGSQSLRRASSEEPKVHRPGHGFVEPDIRGIKLLRSVDFWQLFSIMGILAGIGLMTINNIGNDVKALWKHYDDSVSDDSIMKHQQLHVSILSICSFLGRLLSGVGSDFLVKNLNASRIWCLVLACILFLMAQISALNIVNPHYLGLVSGLSGIAYGFLFGVYPSITAETFGIQGLSQNWGLMTVSPVISSNIFNIFYGVACYRLAYWVTLGACISGISVTLWAIHYQRAQATREQKKAEMED